MAVYQVGSSNSLLAVLSPAAVACALSEYGAIVGGSTPWTTSGGAFVRTESLADYSARIPSVTATSSCAPSPTTAQGQVREKVVVRGGYLVGVRLTVVVPPQRLANGTPVAHGTEGDAFDRDPDQRHAHPHPRSRSAAFRTAATPRRAAPAASRRCVPGGRLRRRN